MIALCSTRHGRLLAGLVAITGLCLTTLPAAAQQSFANPEEAASALVAAVKGGVKQDMLKVLGSGGEDIISSGDDVADADKRSKFVAAYDAKHSVKVEGKRASLIIGADDFPFPVPLVRSKAGWEFDTAAGLKEILFRRIGRNELDTIQTILAFVDAEDEYADTDHGEGVGVYAQHIVSSPGKKDGLFWRDDNDPSPLGALAAEAASEGYKATGQGAPYHGYYFRILKGQGANAPGGALDYVVKDKMIGGYGLIAWPAEYGNSGVMTFVVNHGGTVYQKDLGPRTNSIASRITLFDPDQTWKKVDATKQ